MRRRLSAIALAASAVVMMSACQTARLREIAGIENGMSKSEVLYRAGGPQRVDRKGGKDIWTYIIPDNRRDILKEVDFTDERVTYVGDRILPTGPSAAEQDRLNEASNAKSEAERHRDQLLQEVGSAKQKSAGTSLNAATYDDSVEDDRPAQAPKPVYVPLDSGGSSQ